MAQAVSQNLENWQAKLDKILHEKNAFTDLLEKAEKKSGVRRLYLVLGELRFFRGRQKPFPSADCCVELCMHWPLLRKVASCLDMAV